MYTLQKKKSCELQLTRLLRKHLDLHLLEVEVPNHYIIIYFIEQCVNNMFSASIG